MIAVCSKMAENIPTFPKLEMRSLWVLSVGKAVRRDPYIIPRNTTGPRKIVTSQSRISVQIRWPLQCGKTAVTYPKCVENSCVYTVIDFDAYRCSPPRNVSLRQIAPRSVVWYGTFLLLALSRSNHAYIFLSYGSLAHYLFIPVTHRSTSSLIGHAVCAAWMARTIIWSYPINNIAVETGIELV